MEPHCTYMYLPIHIYTYRCMYMYVYTHVHNSIHKHVSIPFTLLMSETSLPSGGYQVFCLLALSLIWMLKSCTSRLLLSVYLQTHHAHRYVYSTCADVCMLVHVLYILIISKKDEAKLMYVCIMYSTSQQQGITRLCLSPAINAFISSNKRVNLLFLACGVAGVHNYMYVLVVICAYMDTSDVQQQRINIGSRRCGNYMYVGTVVMRKSINSIGCLPCTCQKISTSEFSTPYA